MLELRETAITAGSEKSDQMQKTSNPYEPSIATGKSNRNFYSGWIIIPVAGVTGFFVEIGTQRGPHSMGFGEINRPIRFVLIGLSIGILMQQIYLRRKTLR